MRIHLLLIIIIPLYISACLLSVQAKSHQSAVIKMNKSTFDVRLYGGLAHQHQNFFQKAFSLQGIETGVMINHKFLIGAFGSTFISRLSAMKNGELIYINMWQSGLSIGIICKEKKRFHSGWMINAGHFSMTGDCSEDSLWRSNNLPVKIIGTVLTTQLFTELNVAKWMKLRSGVGYSFYSFSHQSILKDADLQPVSFTFGFLFGNFN